MKIKAKLKEKIAILGLGYVGMPTFLVLSNIKKKYLSLSSAWDRKK